MLRIRITKPTEHLKYQISEIPAIEAEEYSQHRTPIAHPLPLVRSIEPQLQFSAKNQREILPREEGNKVSGTFDAIKHILCNFERRACAEFEYCSPRKRARARDTNIAAAYTPKRSYVRLPRRRRKIFAVSRAFPRSAAAKCSNSPSNWEARGLLCTMVCPFRVLCMAKENNCEMKTTEWPLASRHE